MYRTILKHISNVPGWSTPRKIVVFESDDWGSTRMHSKEAYQGLLNEKVRVDCSPYCKVDALETNSDLERLFKVLGTYRDSQGNPPSFTAMCIMANPDFQKIQESNFQNYDYKVVTELAKTEQARSKIIELWLQGFEQGLFRPEFHGREHLNVARWMTDLRNGVKATRAAFKYNVNGIGPDVSSDIKKSYQAAFDVDNPSQIEDQRKILIDGLAIFERIMGYRASYFVPTNGPFNSSLEETLYQQGIRYINTAKAQLEPLGNDRYKKNFRKLGMTNRFGQIYTTRNCAFEPSLLGERALTQCLHEINSAFLFRKPAIISTHRLNYAGSLDMSNAEFGVRQLDTLVKTILKRWPQVEFMTTPQLGTLMRKGND